MTDDKALEILDKALMQLPKGSGWREQAHQALLHLERNRVTTRVSMGPLEALEAVGVKMRAVSTRQDARVHDEVRLPAENMMKTRLSHDLLDPLTLEWKRVEEPKRTIVESELIGVFLTEEQLKQYWSVLAYGE